VELRWAAYPTAKISSSVWLWVTRVTGALQAESRQRPSNSPFLTSQHKTASLAPTIARPAPVWRPAVAICSSLAQIAFDDAEATSPNVFECSNLLHETLAIAAQSSCEWHVQIRLHHRRGWMGKFLETSAIDSTKLITGGDSDPSGSPTAHDDRPSPTVSFHSLSTPPLPRPSCFSWIIRTF